MFLNPFITNRVMQDVLKLRDVLSLGLRENVELFDYNDGIVNYLTASNRIIEASYNPKTRSLSNISVEDADVFEDDQAIDEASKAKSKKILAGLLANDLHESRNELRDLLNVWSTRIKFRDIKNRIEEKRVRLQDYEDIVDSAQFSQLNELRDNLVKFIGENKDTLKNIKSIKEGLSVANSIKNALNTPKYSYDTLSEQEIGIDSENFDTVYEYVCKQELATQELLEAKKNLNLSWVINDKLTNLSKFIGSEDSEEFATALAEAIESTPYLALASKKQIKAILENLCEDVSSSELKNFIAKIYELKKEVKAHLITQINEKYGINVNSLKFRPNFHNLSKINRVIFETLTRAAPRNSQLKSNLRTFTEILESRTGVQSVDLINWVNDLFEEAGYVNETSLMNYLDFESVAQDLSNIGNVLRMIKSKMQMQSGMTPPQMEPGVSPEEMPNPSLDADSDGGFEGELPEPQMDADDAAAEAQGEFESEQDPNMDSGEMEGELGGEEEDDLPDTQDIDSEDLQSQLSELDALISDLKLKMGGEEDEMEDELEGEEDDIDIDTGDGDDEIHLDNDSHDEEGEGDNDTDEPDDEDEEDDDAPPFKK